MQIRELRKQTPEEHPDFDKLEGAVTALEDVANAVNAGLRAADTRAEFLKLPFRNLHAFIQPHRDFVAWSRGNDTVKSPV